MPAREEVCPLLPRSRAGLSVERRYCHQHCARISRRLELSLTHARLTLVAGTHMYIAGTGIGSAFAPPDVFIGINTEARCVVQPFTSTRNRLHCIISGEGLPPPDVAYTSAGRFAHYPLRVVRDNRVARCWHVGGHNHACFIRFDLGATPRVERLLTPVLQSAGLVRMSGKGIDGGVLGAPGMVGSLYRGGGQLVVGVCGEKDCAPSNLGVEMIGCLSRAGGSGDAVAEGQTVAYAFSDETNFGCKLDTVAGGLTGGFFNISLHAIDALHRGDAYMGFSTTERVDYANGGAPYDAELLPRITRVAPSMGSLAGGADITIYGSGFGPEPANLMITVGDGSARCAITSSVLVAWRRSAVGWRRREGRERLRRDG